VVRSSDAKGEHKLFVKAKVHDIDHTGVFRNIQYLEEKNIEAGPLMSVVVSSGNTIRASLVLVSTFDIMAISVMALEVGHMSHQLRSFMISGSGVSQLRSFDLRYSLSPLFYQYVYLAIIERSS